MPDRMEQAELGRTLRALRESVGMHVADAARMAGFSQSTVTRYENADSWPSTTRLDALLALYGGHGAHVEEGTREALHATIEAHRSRPGPVVFRGDPADRQHDIAERERESQSITSLGATLIPGLLQTEGYIRAVATAGGRVSGERLDTFVAERLLRQRILSETGRELLQLVLPGALLSPPGGGVMSEQLRHLDVVARLPTVRLGVIPPGREVDVFPMHSLDLYVSRTGQRSIIFGSIAGMVDLDREDVVDRAASQLEKIERVAVFGDAARDVLADAGTMTHHQPRPL